jgi:hypothetical protein
MTLAFLIYAYFPYGGQQRDFLRVALACAARGHKVMVYTMKWEGPAPEALDITLLDVKSFRNHKRSERFAAQVHKLLQESPVDAVIGFNKMPGLDVYFAADPCFAERALKERAFYYRYTPRYRHFLRHEQAVFGPQARTEALLLSPLQRQQFAQHYPQSVRRLHDIPPGISRDRQPPANAAQERAAFRAEHGLDAEARPLVEAVGGARAFVVFERLEPEPVAAVVVEDAAGPAPRRRRIDLHLVTMKAHARGGGRLDAADDNPGVEAAGLEALELQDEIAERFFGAEKRVLRRAAHHVAGERSGFDVGGGARLGTHNFPTGEVAAVEKRAPRSLGGEGRAGRAEESEEERRDNFHARAWQTRSPISAVVVVPPKSTVR